MPGSGVAALEAAPLRGLIHEAFHIVAVLPGKVEKLAGRQVGGLFAQERFKAPTDVRTLPRVEPVAPRRVPVIVKRLEHLLRNGRNSPSPLRQDPSSLPSAWKGAREQAPSLRRAFPRSPCTGGLFQLSYRPLIFLSNALARSSTRSFRAASPSGLCQLSA